MLAPPRRSFLQRAIELVTRLIIETAKPLGISVHDHVIIG